MKTLSLLSLLCSLVPAIAQDQPSTAPVPGAPAAPAAKQEEGQPQLLPNQQAFLNLPEERRKEFIKNLGEANRLFQQKRIFETLNLLNKCDAIFTDSPETLNIRGACYVEFRAFDKAMTAFEKALALAPDNPSVLFNIGEVQFVNHDWQKASDTLEKVLKAIPKEQMALSRLVEFKILLCKKKLGKDAEAKAMGEKYDIDDDSPYHCYAKAALAYEAKNEVLAEEWLARAGRIFQNPEVLAPWQDTLVEYGYIKSFYGNDLSEGEE
jgi:Tfp pilus assembly protein PilF